MEYASSAANSGGYIEYRMPLNETRSTMLLRITREMPSAVSVKFLQHSTAQQAACRVVYAVWCC
jgi:hypothetical protein